MQSRKVESVSITVKCPESPWIKVKMPMRRLALEKGGYLYSCDGCDGASASDVCRCCISSLIRMYSRGHQLDDDEIVTPDFSLLQ